MRSYLDLVCPVSLFLYLVRTSGLGEKHRVARRVNSIRNIDELVLSSFILELHHCTVPQTVMQYFGIMSLQCTIPVAERSVAPVTAKCGPTSPVRFFFRDLIRPMSSVLIVTPVSILPLITVNDIET